MRKIRIVVLIISVLLFGCQGNSKKVSLRYYVGNIETIELLCDTNISVADEWKVLYVLSDSEIDAFVDVLCNLNIYKHWSPSGHWGHIFIRISYLSGDQEIFGTGAIEYISATGESNFDDWHYIYYYDMYDLFVKYVSQDELPSL